MRTVMNLKKAIPLLLAVLLCGCFYSDPPLPPEPDSSDISVPVSKVEVPDSASATVTDAVSDACEKMMFRGYILAEKDGERVIDMGYGYADVKNSVLSNADTVYETGALTEQFTSAAIFRLYDEGIVSLSSPISWFVDIKDDRPASLLQLMNMHGGYADYMSCEPLRKINAVYNSYTPEDLLNFVSDSKKSFISGEGTEYSATNYLLLGMAIENATDIPYEKYMNDVFLSSLGVPDCGFEINKPCETKAVGYCDSTEAIPINPSVTYAAGALCASPNALLAWQKAFYSGDVISVRSLQAMLTFDENNYSCGIFRHEKYGCYFSSGETPGYRATMSYSPDKNLYIVVLSNDQTADVSEIRNVILEYYK